MIHTITDITAKQLLQTIRENPEDDTPRLLLADRLDEIGPVRVVCEKCEGSPRGRRAADGVWIPSSTREPCDKCKGTGTVLDDTLQKWGELIRVQHEFDHHPGMNCGELYCSRRSPTGLCDACRRYQYLLERRAILLPLLEPLLRRGATCERCSKDRPGWRRYTRQDDEQPRPRIRVQCEYCSGTGYAGVLSEIRAPQQLSKQNWEWTVPITRWRCGFPDEIRCTREWLFMNQRRLKTEWPGIRINMEYLIRR